MAYCVKTAITSLHCSSHLSRASNPVRVGPRAAASNIRLCISICNILCTCIFFSFEKKKQTSIRTSADNIMAHSTSVNTLF